MSMSRPPLPMQSRQSRHGSSRFSSQGDVFQGVTMLRKSRNPFSRQDQTCSPRPVLPSIETDQDVHHASHTQTWRSTSFEQGRIYQEWINAGKPHYIVCSACHLPENLLGCETCCRSYHPQCLLPPTQSNIPGNIYCQSCRAKAWDQEPPQFLASPGASSPSRVATPGTTSGRRSSQSAGPTLRQLSASSHDNPLNTHNKATGASGDIVDFDHGQPPDTLPPVGEMYSQVIYYLAHRDGLYETSRQPEFARQLGLMMREIESHREKMATLRQEYARVQSENMQIRTYLNARLPSREPILSSPSVHSTFPRPSADTSGRSWDSIVLDLI